MLRHIGFIFISLKLLIMNIKYLTTKILKKIRGSAIKNSSIHPTSKSRIRLLHHLMYKSNRYSFLVMIAKFTIQKLVHFVQLLIM